jgi:hypothetical protein
MPDVWATVARLDSTVQERLADVLETRGADPRQQDMRRRFLATSRCPPPPMSWTSAAGRALGRSATSSPRR